MPRLFTLLASLGLLSVSACASTQPLPPYPAPVDPPIDETDLADFLEPAEDGDAAETDDDWDDGGAEDAFGAGAASSDDAWDDEGAEEAFGAPITPGGDEEGAPSDGVSAP